MSAERLLHPRGPGMEKISRTGLSWRNGACGDQEATISILLCLQCRLLLVPLLMVCTSRADSLKQTRYAGQESLK